MLLEIRSCICPIVTVVDSERARVLTDAEKEKLGFAKRNCRIPREVWHSTSEPKEVYEARVAREAGSKAELEK